MTDELEKQLRQVLRPVDPGEEMTQRILARVDAERAAETARRGDAAPPTEWPVGANIAAAGSAPVVASARRPARRGARPAWGYVALAASVALVALGVSLHDRQQRQREAGLEARSQVLAALHVTSEKLDLAYRLVKQTPDR